MPRTVVLVVGSGRSGTSTAVGALRRLGVHVPQPEVPPDITNPRGFSEPQWAVDFHNRLLGSARVQNGDARPQAWHRTARIAARPAARAELHEWLEQQFALADEIVVKDPRMAWFLPLWRDVAAQSGARTAVVTMLRHPAEVIGSKDRYYNRGGAQQHLLAGWVNMMTRTEHLTRDMDRVVVSYDELIRDWRTPFDHVGRVCGVAAVRRATVSQRREVDRFIDPDLRRVHLTWQDVRVTEELRGMASAVWDLIDRMTDPAGDNDEVRRRLDETRAAFAAYYAGEEALAQSSREAARQYGADWRRRRVAEGLPVP